MKKPKTFIDFFTKTREDFYKAKIDFDRKTHEYKALEKQLGLKINCENQKKLALLGANQQIIDKNINSKLYEISIK